MITNLKNEIISHDSPEVFYARWIPLIQKYDVVVPAEIEMLLTCSHVHVQVAAVKYCQLTRAQFDRALSTDFSFVRKAAIDRWEDYRMTEAQCWAAVRDSDVVVQLSAKSIGYLTPEQVAFTNEWHGRDETLGEKVSLFFCRIGNGIYDSIFNRGRKS